MLQVDGAILKGRVIATCMEILKAMMSIDRSPEEPGEEG